MALIKLNNARAAYRLPKRVKRGMSNIFGHTYEEIIALHDITLECNKGDHIGIIGANGSGKSTLLKLIGGVIPPRRGSIEIQGERIVLMDRMAGMLMMATVEENAWIKAAFYGLKGIEIDNFVAKVLADSGLHKKASVPLRTLSAGMIAKFNLAVNTQIVKPITIMDEWIGMTDTSQSSYGGLLHRITQEVDILLLASHNEALIRKLCNRIILLDKGELRYDGPDLNLAYQLYYQDSRDANRDSDEQQQDDLFSSESSDIQSTDDSAPMTEDAESQASSQKPEVKLEIIESQAAHDRFKSIHILKTNDYCNQLVKQILKQSPVELDIKFEPVMSTVRAIPEGEKVAFFVKDPVRRIVDGFYQRKNMFETDVNNRTFELEAKVFRQYSDLDQLVADFSSTDRQTQIIANKALHNINSIRDSYWRWGFNEQYLLSRKSDISFIGFEDSIINDLKLFFTLLGVDVPQDLIEQMIADNPPANIDINEATSEFLKQWCAEDYRFINLCKTLRGGD